MTHDPLCPSHGLCDCGCEYNAHCACAFIAKVREDERAAATAEWMSNHGDRWEFTAGQRDALARYPFNVHEFRKAVLDEAVQRVEQAYDWSGIDNDAWVSGQQFGTAINKVIAAIKGEQP